MDIIYIFNLLKGIVFIIYIIIINIILQSWQLGKYYFQTNITCKRTNGDIGRSLRGPATYKQYTCKR